MERIIVVLTHGYNARKVISEVTHLLYCGVLSLGGNVNLVYKYCPERTGFEYTQLLLTFLAL